MEQESLIAVRNLKVCFKKKTSVQRGRDSKGRYKKTVQNSQKIILDGVNFAIKKNKITVILGNNGSGKSTLLKVLSCLTDMHFRRKIIIEKSANIMFEGKNILEKHSKKFVSRVQQAIAFSAQNDDKDCYEKKLTFREALLNACTISDAKEKEKKVSELIRYFDAESIQNLKIDSLSGGQMRLMSVLECFVQFGKSVYFIDEPFNDLDDDKAKRVVNYIMDMHEKLPDIAIVVVTHCKKIIATEKKEVEAYLLEEGRLTPCEYKTVYCLGQAKDGRYIV